MKSVLLACLVACLCPCTALAQDLPFLGTWEWVSTSYSSGDFEDPGTVGYQVELFFELASEPLFVRYHDEARVESGPWYAGSVLIGPCCIEILGTDFGDNWQWQTWLDNDGTWMRLQTGFECPGYGGGPPIKTELYFLRGPVANQAKSWGHVKACFR